MMMILNYLSTDVFVLNMFVTSVLLNLFAITCNLCFRNKMNRGAFSIPVENLLSMSSFM